MEYHEYHEKKDIELYELMWQDSNILLLVKIQF